MLHCLGEMNEMNKVADEMLETSTSNCEKRSVTDDGGAILTSVCVRACVLRERQKQVK